MKKITFITMASLLSMTLANCASGKNQLNNLLNKVYIGMPIAEFNKICPKKPGITHFGFVEAPQIGVLWPFWV